MLFTGLLQLLLKRNCSAPLLGLLKQIRRQLERHKTIGFNEQSNALHVRYKFWYISSPSLANQQGKMTKLKVMWRT